MAAVKALANDCGHREQLGLLRLATVLSLFLVAGCSNSPGRIEAPDWDPPELADRVLEDLDKNGDEQVDAAEVAAAPGLMAATSVVDKDGDKRLSRAELETHFAKCRDKRTGLATQMFRLVYKGRPVGNAEVVFTPEPFLEDTIEPATGQSDESGAVMPSVEGQDVPGMRLGFYRVQIKSAPTKLPERYLSEGTPLGAHVSPPADSGYAPTVALLTLTD